MYGDPTLDKLMAQVDVSNQTLKDNEAAYRQAVALIRQTQSQLYPTFGYTGSDLRERSGGGTWSSDGNLEQLARQSRSASTRLAVAGSWEIDVWGRIRRTIEATRPRRRRAPTSGRRALSTQSSLVTNYYSLRISDARRRLFEESLAAYGPLRSRSCRTRSMPASPRKSISPRRRRLHQI